MKNLILSLVMLTSSFISFSQVVEIEFDTHLAINCGKHITYEEVIDAENIKMFQYSKGAGNRYVIDLDKKTATLYSNGVFINENPIIDHTTKDGLLYVTTMDTELLTSKKVKSYIVINQNVKDTRHPKFTFFFISTLDGTSNGVKTI
jgi:hypothetical protein